jgi:hypothetical protein
MACALLKLSYPLRWANLKKGKSSLGNKALSQNLWKREWPLRE